jgi:serine/threonine-protein phosphatase 4 regulatory subunit 4
MNGEDSATTSKPLEYTSGPGPPPPPARAQTLSLVLPPKKMSPPPYSVATAVHNLKGSDTTSSPAQSPSSTSFTTTFLRGILSSIDSKDPVVANAWLETLMDAIDLLPTDVIRNEIVSVAVSKGQLSQPASARRSSCRLLGKIATKLDALSVRQDVLPTSLALCQDVDADVRNCMCRQLTVVAKAVGMEATKAAILPTLVELSNDESPQVRRGHLALTSKL